MATSTAAGLSVRRSSQLLPLETKLFLFRKRGSNSVLQCQNNLTYDCCGGCAPRPRVALPEARSWGLRPQKEPRWGSARTPLGDPHFDPSDPHFDPSMPLYIPLSLQEGLEAERQKGTGGGAPRGVWGGAPTGVWGRSPKLHSCGEAPSFILAVKPPASPPVSGGEAPRNIVS